MNEERVNQKYMTEFMTIRELKEWNKTNPTRWLVADLLKEGSFNLITGGAKSGKSTLARQLAACLSTGTEFLGRAVAKSDTLYIHPDEPDSSEIEHALGALKADIDRIRVPRRALSPDDLLSTLERNLETFPDTRCVILDTLAKCVALEDSDNYSKVDATLGRLVALAARCKVTIVALHHNNKRDTRKIGSAILGSTALTGNAVTTISLFGEGNEPRTIATLQRYGTSLEETELTFQWGTRTMSLGRALCEVEAEDKQSKKIDHLARIRKLVNDAGPEGIFHRDLMKAAGGNATTALTAINHLFDLGTFTRKGKGTPKSPYSYHSLTEIPTETPVRKAA
jgi:RecA-family ATPase